jgi:hypothetical protein
MKPKVTKMNPRNSPAQPAPTKDPTASDVLVGADVAVDAAGAAVRKKVV